MKKTLSIALVLFILSMSLTGCFKKELEAVNQDYQKALYESLYTQNAYLENIDKIKQSDLTVKISNTALAKILSPLEGVQIKPKSPPEKFPDLMVTIKKATLTPNSGAADVDLELELTSVKKKINAKIYAKGALLFDGAPAADKSESVNFVVKLRRINAGISWGFLSLSKSRLLNDYITVTALKELEDPLRLALPSVDFHKQTLEINEEKLVRDKKSSTVANLNIRSLPFEFQAQTSVDAFVFGSQGILLFGSIDEGVIPAPSVPSVPDLDMQNPEMVSKMASKMSDLKTRISESGVINAPISNDIEVVLSSRSVQKIIGKYNALAPELRRVKVKSNRVDGRLYENIWKDDTSAGGEIYAELMGSDAVSANAYVSQIKHFMDENGINYSASAQVDAKARVKTRFAPLMGKGLNRTWNLTGQANPSLTGTVELSIAPINGVGVVVAKNTFVCDRFKLEIDSDTVPKLGIITGVKIGGHTPKFSSIFGGKPYFVDLNKKAESGKIIVVFSHAFLKFDFIPVDVSTDADGLNIKVDLGIQKVDALEDTAALKQTLKAEMKNLSTLEPKPTCPTKDPLRVLLAGDDLDKNNKTVKELNRLIDGFKTGVGKIKGDLKK